MSPFRKTVLWGALACVVALLLFVVWWNADGEKDKSAGRQESVESAPSAQSGRSLGERMRSLFPGWGWQSLGQDTAKEVEEAVRKTFAAYNKQNLRAFKSGWTDQGFQQAYGLPKEKATDFGLLSLLSFRPYTIGEFSNTSVNAETAATEVGLTYGEVHEPHRFSLIREDDAWKIDHDEKLALIAKDAAVVDVKLQFFKIQMERTRLAPGTVAFKIGNADTRQHEFIVKRITESESEETIGKIKPLEPGQNETLILTNLMPGRYVALCNMISRDGVPYSYGMRSEFLVE